MAATAESPSTSVLAPGTGAKLMAMMNVPTSTTERMPPRLSTGSFVSWTWAGTNRSAMMNATTASGMTARKTEGQE